MFETFADFGKMDGALTPFFRPAFGGPVATEEESAKSLECIIKVLDQLEKRFSADGRAYCSGDKICAADFGLVAFGGAVLPEAAVICET